MNKSSRSGGPPSLPQQQMPGFVKSALASKNLTDAYQARPKYQQTEYLAWINSAKLQDAKKARLNQMLEELAKGGVFKGEPWTPPAPVAPAAK
jgi:uncharacterized protein YdeI (YjbR/CyaY-like superfamily)